MSGKPKYLVVGNRVAMVPEEGVAGFLADAKGQKVASFDDEAAARAFSQENAASAPAAPAPAPAPAISTLDARVNADMSGEMLPEKFAKPDEGALTAASRGAQNALLFDYAPQVSAALQSKVFPLLPRSLTGAGAGVPEYGDVLKDEKAARHQSEVQHPVATLGGNIVGGVLQGGLAGMATKGIRATQAGVKIGSGARSATLARQAAPVAAVTLRQGLKAAGKHVAIGAGLGEAGAFQSNVARSDAPTLGGQIGDAASLLYEDPFTPALLGGGLSAVTGAASRTLNARGAESMKKFRGQDPGFDAFVETGGRVLPRGIFDAEILGTPDMIANRDKMVAREGTQGQQVALREAPNLAGVLDATARKAANDVSPIAERINADLAGQRTGIASAEDAALDAYMLGERGAYDANQTQEQIAATETGARVETIAETLAKSDARVKKAEADLATASAMDADNVANKALTHIADDSRRTGEYATALANKVAVSLDDMDGPQYKRLTALTDMAADRPDRVSAQPVYNILDAISREHMGEITPAQRTAALESQPRIAGQNPTELSYLNPELVAGSAVPFSKTSGQMTAFRDKLLRAVEEADPGTPKPKGPGSAVDRAQAEAAAAPKPNTRLDRLTGAAQKMIDRGKAIEEEAAAASPEKRFTELTQKQLIVAIRAVDSELDWANTHGDKPYKAQMHRVSGVLHGLLKEPVAQARGAESSHIGKIHEYQDILGLPKGVTGDVGDAQRQIRLRDRLATMHPELVQKLDGLIDPNEVDSFRMVRERSLRHRQAFGLGADEMVDTSPDSAAMIRAKNAYAAEQANPGSTVIGPALAEMDPSFTHGLGQHASQWLDNIKRMDAEVRARAGVGGRDVGIAPEMLRDKIMGGIDKPGAAVLAPRVLPGPIDTLNMSREHLSDVRRVGGMRKDRPIIQTSDSPERTDVRAKVREGGDAIRAMAPRIGARAEFEKLYAANAQYADDIDALGVKADPKLEELFSVINDHLVSPKDPRMSRLPGKIGDVSAEIASRQKAGNTLETFGLPRGSLSVDAGDVGVTNSIARNALKIEPSKWQQIANSTDEKLMRSTLLTILGNDGYGRLLNRMYEATTNAEIGVAASVSGGAFGKLPLFRRLLDNANLRSASRSGQKVTTGFTAKAGAAVAAGRQGRSEERRSP